MDKKESEKNILDLEYKKQLQIQNSTLILGTTSLLPLIISFIWYKERWIIGLTLTLAIGLTAYLWYKKSDRELKIILEKIKNI